MSLVESRREAIFKMEAVMLTLPQVDLPVKHTFAKGLYAREMLIPKGVLLTGMIHRQSHLLIVLRGDIEIATEEGTRRLRTGDMAVASAGTKRAGYAFEDTLVVTILGTELTDPEEIEDKLTCNSFQELLT